MDNVGRKIKDSYCNGFAGRRYDLEGSIIEHEGDDYMVIRTEKGEPIFIGFLHPLMTKYTKMDGTTKTNKK
jgi:hypothetical protein